MGQCSPIRPRCSHTVKKAVVIMLSQFPLKHLLFVRFTHFFRGGQKTIPHTLPIYSVPKHFLPDLKEVSVGGV